MAHYQHIHAPQDTRVWQETGYKVTWKTKSKTLHIQCLIHTLSSVILYKLTQHHCHRPCTHNNDQSYSNDISVHVGMKYMTFEPHYVCYKYECHVVSKHKGTEVTAVI